jgi:hypothetical protein
MKMWVKSSSARVYVFRIESSNLLTKDVKSEIDIYDYYISLGCSKNAPDIYRLPISPECLFCSKVSILFNFTISNSGADYSVFKEIKYFLFVCLFVFL